MKKLVVMLLATLTMAALAVGDWEETYKVNNNCGKTIEVVHNKNFVGLIDGKYHMIAKSVVLKGVEINGCVYNVSLDSEISQPAFESQMLEAGFRILGKKSVSIQPVKSDKS